MTIETRPVVVDAGPLIHLDQLDSLDLLSDFPSLHVTGRVWEEARRHRPGLLPKALAALVIHEVWVAAMPLALRAQAEALDLSAGEVTALMLMRQLSAAILLCDDSAARLLAESLGYRVHGTIGIIIRSIRRRLRSKGEALARPRGLWSRSSG